MSTRQRDYSEIVRRLKRAAGRKLRELCAVRGIAYYWLEFSAGKQASHSVAVTAGIHGDEPAGVEAVVRFLEKPTPGWAKGIRFVIFPCMNPFGYEHNRRTNYAGLDVNRQYRDSALPEVRAQKRVMRGRRFDLHITLHEDVDARGFYIYELTRTPRQIALQIVQNVMPIIPFDPRLRIEGRRARNGLIRRNVRPGRRKHWPEAFYMFFHHADHTLTTETPGKMEMEKRVKAQLIALATACRFVQSLND